MSVRGWARLRRAVAMGRRHQEAVSGSWRWRALVHEAHRRTDLALQRHAVQMMRSAVEKQAENNMLARYEDEL